MAESSRGSWIISIVALGIGIVALLLSLGIPFAAPGGAPGPQGQEGPQGPEGNGTLMVRSSTSAGQRITAVCNSYLGAEVTLTVPGPGTIVVTAQLQLFIEHGQGTDQVVRIGLSGVSGEGCSEDAPVFGGFFFISAPQPSDTYVFNPFLQRPFVIVNAGTYTYYVDTGMTSGASIGDRLAGGVMVAVFYPS